MATQTPRSASETARPASTSPSEVQDNVSSDIQSEVEGPTSAPISEMFTTPRTQSQASSISPSPAPTSADKGKMRQFETPVRLNRSYSAAVGSPPSTARGGLDPRSNVFTPLRPLDQAMSGDSRDSRSMSSDREVPEADTSLGSARSRLSLQSNASTVIRTPASQLSPSWASTPNTSTSLYTSQTNTPDLKGRNLFDTALHYSAAEGRQPEEPGRFLMITNVPTTASGSQVRGIIEQIATYKAIIVKNLRTQGRVVVAFYDDRDTMKVADRLSVSSVRFAPNGPSVQLNCVLLAPDSARQIIGSGDEADQVWRASESAIRIEVHVHGPHGIEINGMRKCLQMIGDLKRFEAHDLAGKSFTAEFHDTRRAADAIRLLNNHRLEEGILSVSYVSDDPFNSAPVGSTRSHNSSISYTLGMPGHSSHSSSSSNPYSTAGGYDRSMSSASSSAPVSPMARSGLGMQFDSLSLQSDHVNTRDASAWRMSPESEPLYGGYDSNTQLQALGRQLSEPAALQGILNQIDTTARARQQMPSVAPQWGQAIDRQAIPPENRIHPDRIANGLDGRTTVMIKDVPNKLSREELITILSEVVPGEFDFVYLRFDFNNHCNVGYAFVNFTSVKALYTFYHAKVGKKWNMFSSEKVLQMSYANIQGKAALVNKFRNSAVMEVIEEWRPQIFYSSGALKGKPEPFPEKADNPSMRHRSTSARLSFLSGAVNDNSTPDRTDYDYSSYGF